MNKNDVVISKRLQAIAKFVRKGACIADIGTDHAYLPIYLVQAKDVPKAIAIDVKGGPIRSAKANVEKYDLEDKIEVRWSNGLAELLPHEVDTVIIAGMGGKLMQTILEKEKEIAHTMRNLILQPQSEIAEFRRFLCKNNYVIVDEDMLIEDEKYYTIIHATIGESKELSEVEELYGEHLIKQKNIALKQYLLREENHCKVVLRKLRRLMTRTDHYNVEGRMKVLEHQLKLIRGVLREYDE
jgi:tRNA (adenine22-N1)-methyltransferase